MQLQIAMIIFYDLMMQCLHCLRNAHESLTNNPINVSADD